MEQIDRRIEANFSKGWGMAAFITALVLAAFATAGFIHIKTFRHPRDTTAEYRKEKGHGAEGTTAEPAKER